MIPWLPVPTPSWPTVRPSRSRRTSPWSAPYMRSWYGAGASDVVIEAELGGLAGDEDKAFGADLTHGRAIPRA